MARVAGGWQRKGMARAAEESKGMARVAEERNGKGGRGKDFATVVTRSMSEWERRNFVGNKRS
jgi:hypothetical protein